MTRLMPSPIAHSVVGLALAKLFLPSSGRAHRKLGLHPLIAASAMALALLPDLGSIAGLVTGDFGRFHNSWEHSLIVGLLLATVVGALVFLTRSPRAVRWFLVALLCFELHVLMDFLTWGRGVKLLWPFFSARLQPPMYLFYGLHWSNGWLSYRHLVTLATELLFVALLVLIVHRGSRDWLVRALSRRKSLDHSLDSAER